MTTHPLKTFRDNIRKRVSDYRDNETLQNATQNFMEELVKAKNSYNYHWLGIPIIQIPQDLMAMQELIWEIKPDFIVETGIAHGGSLIFYASMLQLVGKGRVIGIDIDIRPHNRAEIERHPLSRRITMIEGSSTSTKTVEEVRRIIGADKKVIVCLDSNHTHDHVLKELELYTPLVSKHSYCIVYDTGIEDMDVEGEDDRPWGKGNNPKTAVFEFLKHHSNFKIDDDIHTKLLITAAPDGYLYRCK